MYLALLQGIATLVMAYLGYHYAVPHTTSPRARWMLRFAFIGLSAVSLALIGAQARKTDQDQERAEVARKDAEDAQRHTQATLDETQGNVAVLQAKVDKIESAMFEPGNTSEKLDTIARIIGTNIVPAKESPQTANVTMALNGVAFKAGTQRLDLLMRAAKYDGPTAMSVLMIGTADNPEGLLLVGTDPNLTSQNALVSLYGSESYNFPGGEDISRVYVSSEKAGKLKITYRIR